MFEGMIRQMLQRKRVANFFGDEMGKDQLRAQIRESAKGGNSFRTWAGSLQAPIVLGLDEVSSVRNIYAMQQFEYGEEISFPVFHRNDLLMGVWSVPQLYAQPSMIPVHDMASPQMVEISTAIEWPTRLQEQGRIDVVNNCLRVLTENLVAYEESLGWSVIEAAAQSANPLVTMAAGIDGRDTLSRQFIKAMISGMIEHPTNKRQQRTRSLTCLYAAPSRCLDALDMLTILSDSQKNSIMATGRLETVLGVDLRPYWGLASTTVFGFDLTAPDESFNGANYGSVETRPLASAEDHWRVGVKTRESIGFLIKDARYLIQGAIGS